MIPVLTLLNNVRVYTFGLFLVLAFLFGLFVFWKKGREEHYNEGLLLDAALTACFWGFVGARFGFIALHIGTFGPNLIKWFSLFEYPGFFGLTGTIAGFVTLVSFAKKQKWDIYQVLDFGVLGLSLALAFLSVGMLLNGSGFGNPTRLPIGIQFPGVFDRRQPIQIYSGVLFSVVFFLLLKLESQYRMFLWYRTSRRSAQAGFLLSCFTMFYGLIQFILDFLRPSQIIVFHISLDPVVHFLIILFGAGMLYVRSGRTLPAVHFQKRKKQESHEQTDAHTA